MARYIVVNENGQVENAIESDGTMRIPGKFIVMDETGEHDIGDTYKGDIVLDAPDDNRGRRPEGVGGRPDGN